MFEVCRLREHPIKFPFINKMDRESRDPFDLLDEIEKTMALGHRAESHGRSGARRDSSAPSKSIRRRKVHEGDKPPPLPPRKRVAETRVNAR